jgi:hypothetical protein
MPVRIGLRRELLVMCAACRTVAAAMGSSVAPVVVHVVERRARVVDVATERRHFRPAWLRNLTARDETGRVAA